VVRAAASQSTRLALAGCSLLAWYALEPANFVIPVLGVLDDFVLLPLVLHAVLKFLPMDIRVSFLTRPLPR